MIGAAALGVHRRVRWLLVVVGVAVAPLAAQPPSNGTLAPAFPGLDWDSVSSPEEAGYQRAGLQQVTRYLSGLHTTAFMAVVGGRVLFAYGDLDSLSYLASVRKSILSMLYGRYVEAGDIDLGATLADLGIDDRLGLSEQEREATIEDLLTARSGVYHPASNPGDNLEQAPTRGSQRHGTYFLYSNWDFNAAGTVFEQLTGRGIYDALQSDLARPIGMQDFRRSIHRRTGDTTRSRHLAYHMVLSTRDMARLGLLMLREGRWGDEQLIPADWVARSTRTVTPSARMNPPSLRDDGLGYGYLWWTLERPASDPLAGAYSGRGAFGQYIMVVPKLDLVIVHKRAPSRGDQAPVGWEPFMGAVQRLIGARCQGPC